MPENLHSARCMSPLTETLLYPVIHVISICEHALSPLAYASARWNPHRAPMLPPPDIAMHTGGAALADSDTPDTGVRTLAQAILPDSCGLSLGQLNYLMVDYTPAELRLKRPTASKHEERGSQTGPRSGARLKVYVNDPGRSGLALLSADVDLWTLIEMGG